MFDAPPHSPIAAETLLAIALGSFLVSFSNPHVPGAAIITMTTGLAAAGLPLEGVAIGAGVDRLTDGFKTVIKCDWQCFQRGHVEPLGKAQNK